MLLRTVRCVRASGPRLAKLRTAPRCARHASTAKASSCAMQPISSNCRFLSSDANQDVKEAEVVDEDVTSSQPDDSDQSHSIITDSETHTGPEEKRPFVAETKRLLQIVAQSLYSDSEVFLRELLSNSCDACEKRRIFTLTQRSDQQFAPLEIHVKTDDVRGQLIIQDTGIGMTREELVENLGTIAQSGSKAFIERMEKQSMSVAKDAIIGQFGVGFYSAFMVAKQVEVFTRPHQPVDAPGVYWSSEGADSYVLQEAANVTPGTKIVLHLKDDCLKYAQENAVMEIIKKFTAFFDKPIFVNGMKLPVADPIWTRENPTEAELTSFYQSIVRGGTEPRFTLKYKTDVPVNMRCILFVPGESYNLFSTLTPKDSGADVSLYSRKVLIQPRVDTKILPDWMRFLKGVIDSEDIPLNLSREILQNSDLLAKIKRTLSARVTKFLLDQYKKRPEAYSYFYRDYGDFIREGVLTCAGDRVMQEELMRLLVFQSSALDAGTVSSLDNYIERMKPGQRDIYYISAPSREMAEGSPYMEALAQNEVQYEVLFALQNFDDITLGQCAEYKGNRITSLESAKFGAAKGRAAAEISDSDKELISQFKSLLSEQVAEVKVSPVDFKAPAVIRNFDVSMSRYILNTTLASKSEEDKLKFLQVELEVNAAHPVVKKVLSLKDSDPDLSAALARQILDNALVAAGLTTDSRLLMNRLDSLLTRVAHKL